ncbi:MAG: M20/M25/M40 family metallo-hydrolase [Actinomycetota bacterium]|nr:M20/M25/M40 family metallo-hydrolase [Actinomycetota bacterium]
MGVLARLDELYAIGGGPGANRPYGSPEEDAAHTLVADWMREAGLAVEVDAHGNLFGRSGMRDDIWVGSHLDSVPKGGRFDGPLGVVGGLAAVERSGCGSVVAFRGEEVGCIGSRAFCAGGVALPVTFLELHIEQGPVLERVGAALGVVTSIVGYARGELVFDGRAGHAGTTPMEARNDALVAAAEAVLRIRDAAQRIEGGVATVGQLAVEPGGSNVIPDRVRITVDARAPDARRLDELIEAIGFEPSDRTPPATMAEEPRRALLDELVSRGLRAIELPSGAGHDAGILAAAGVPSAMLFVRSLNGGISHSPDELSSEEDVELAVDVLTASVKRITNDLEPAK